MPSTLVRKIDQFKGGHLERYADDCSCDPRYTTDQEDNTPLSIESLLARVAKLEHAVALLAWDDTDTDTDDGSETEGAKQIGESVTTLGKTVIGKDGKAGKPPGYPTADSLRARTDALLDGTNRAISAMQARNRAAYATGSYQRPD